MYIRGKTSLEFDPDLILIIGILMKGDINNYRKNVEYLVQETLKFDREISNFKPLASVL